MPKPPFTRSAFENTPSHIIKQVEAESGISSGEAIFDPGDNFYLDSQDAANRFRANPASIGFNLMNLHEVFDIPADDIGSEIASGRLVANGYERPGEPGGLALVHGDALVAWVNNPEVPKRIRKKLQRVAGGEGAFFARRVKCVALKTAPMR